MGNCNSCPSKGSCSKEKSSCNIECNPKNKVGKIIGVMSGKGGVGKSTVSTLIAKELNKKGFKVGVLDADITGPSIPRLLGIKDERAMGNGKDIYPVLTKENIKVMSLNLLVANEEEPVLWRGSMISNAVKQFWTDVIWGDLDYLIIDMPPGTGDVALTVMQNIPINGIVMVSIPQDMISMIVSKAVNMAKKMNIEVLGLVQNMSYIVCPGCTEKIRMFDDSESQSLLKDMKLDLLGELPMMKSLSKLSSGYSSCNETNQLVEYMVNNIIKNLNK